MFVVRIERRNETVNQNTMPKLTTTDFAAVA
jgi:hypothetical protein